MSILVSIKILIKNKNAWSESCHELNVGVQGKNLIFSTDESSKIMNKLKKV